jgi:putative mRNA 3-end processing factor
LTSIIDVTALGAVQLGPSIVCDGFHYEADARIQTHVHDDHMTDFEKSKGFQYLYMSAATRELLVAERNADLPYRDNILALRAGVTVEHNGNLIELLPSGHMLGSMQAAVTTAGGQRVGYSGDFAWPLENVIQVDALVVDATYGSPSSRREYSQAIVEARFLELMASQLFKGPVHVVANRGTLHRALQILAGQLTCPIIGSRRLCREVEVYRSFGCCIDDVLDAESTLGRQAAFDGRFVRFYGKGDTAPKEHVLGSRIVLSAFMTRSDDPVLVYSNDSFRIALSDHADFDGTLEYVLATGASHVVTDNTRGGNAVVLANEIRAHLGITAQPSSNRGGAEWAG